MQKILYRDTNKGVGMKSSAVNPSPPYIQSDTLMEEMINAYYSFLHCNALLPFTFISIPVLDKDMLTNVPLHYLFIIYLHMTCFYKYKLNVQVQNTIIKIYMQRELKTKVVAEGDTKSDNMMKAMGPPVHAVYLSEFCKFY